MTVSQGLACLGLDEGAVICGRVADLKGACMIVAVAPDTGSGCVGGDGMHRIDGSCVEVAVYQTLLTDGCSMNG